MGLALRALVYTLAIPIFGFILECILKLILKVLAYVTSNKFAYILVNRVTFIGVVHHELAHALFGVLTGTKISKMDLFKPQGDTLGSVSFSFRGNIVRQSVQKTLIAIAPVVCGALSSCGIVYVFCKFDLPFWGILILGYTLVSIILHMTMSKQDIKVMCKGIPIVYLLVYITLYVIQFI